MSTRLYPLFLNLRGRNCVVLGGNHMAEAKIADLLEAEARVKVIAETVTDGIAEWAREGQVRWEARTYARGDLQGTFLVVSIADPGTNAMVFAEAEERSTLCNAVDDIKHCSCYASAVVQRGPLQIAISTSGNSPALAQRLRRELEQKIGPEYSGWVEELGTLRTRLFQDPTLDNETRRKLLHEQASPAAFEAFQKAHPSKASA